MRAPSALLIVFAALIAPAAAGAQAPPPDPERTTLSVTGTGAVQVRPDTARVSVLVRRVSADREAARASANRRTAQIVAALTRLGIPRQEIQTAGISLSQIRLRPVRRGGPRRLRHVARNELTVRTGRLELVGSIFDVATRAGATEFDGTRFTVENRTPGRADATAAAVADARARADAAAAALGLRVVGVRSVNLDTSPQTQSNDVLPATGAPGSSGTPTPVQPGLEEIDARVTVVFLLGA